MNLTPAIQEAMARRQQGGATPAQQMTPAAPAFDPAQAAPPTPTSSVPGIPSPSGAPTGASASPIPMGQGSMMPSEDPNSTLIIKALSSYLNKKAA